MKRLVRRTTSLVLMSVVLPFAGPGAAQANDTVPFTDPNAQGRLTLCDAEGHMLTEGTLDDAPFANVVVSDTPAKPGYDHTHAAKTTLFAYTPVENVDPGDWISFQISGSSYFSNDAHPMAEVTYRDYTLRDYATSYPHRWDGLVQLRFALGAARKPLILQPYPAAVLKIEGDRWRVVQGGPDDCATGKAISTEKIVLKKEFNGAGPVGATVKPTDSPKPRARATSSASGDASTAPSTARSAGVRSQADGRTPWLLILVIVVGAAVVGTAGIALRDRRRRGMPRS